MSRLPGLDGRIPLTRRTVAMLLAGLVPWVAVPFEAGLSLVFSFGLVNPPSLYVETVVAYVFVDTARLPPSLLAWPTATLLYCLALASASLARVDREDRRVTAALLALAGLDVLYFAVAFSARRMGVVALPLGTALLWLAAWECRGR